MRSLTPTPTLSSFLTSTLPFYTKKIFGVSRTPPVGQKSVFVASKCPRPVTRVSRQNSDLSVIDDGLGCSKCHSAIPYASTHVRLKRCGCSVCLECLVNAHAARGCCLLRCCEMPVVSHRFIDAERVPRKEEVLAVRKETQKKESI
eukprot:scaffold115926_cov22-Cyclotella_meneghiniana.AAC.1